MGQLPVLCDLLVHQRHLVAIGIPPLLVLVVTLMALIETAQFNVRTIPHT